MMRAFVAALCASSASGLRPHMSRIASSSVPVAQGSLQAAVIGRQFTSGNYGAVHAAQATFAGMKVEAVAKRAAAADASAPHLAEEYLDVEAEVNSRLSELSADSFARFARYLGEIHQDGDRWLLWERVGNLDGVAASLADYAGAPGRLEADTGLSPRAVLRQLLECASVLHALGFAHRDIKPENVLINGSRLLLIDMGSCAQLEGCSALDQLASACLGYDASRSPCTPQYAPPEKFVDPLHPWAFDVYSCGMTLLKLCWPVLGEAAEATASLAITDAGETEAGDAEAEEEEAALICFREQLARASHDIDAWLSAQLKATALDPALEASLEAFPAEEPSGLEVVRAMLVEDVARRPSIDALLAHPYLSEAMGEAEGDVEAAEQAVAVGAEGGVATAGTAAAFSSLASALESDGCLLPDWAVEERPLSVALSLQPPLGLLLGELEGGGVSVDGFVDGMASVEARTALLPADRLVRVGDTPVRSRSLETISALIAKRSRGGCDAVRLLFERDCEEECPLPDAPEVLEGMAEPAASAAAVGAVAAAPTVVGAATASILGGRSTQEDTTVLSSFEATPPGE